MKSLILLSILVAVIAITTADEQGPHLRTQEYRVPPQPQQFPQLRTQEYRVPPQPQQFPQLRTQEYRVPPQSQQFPQKYRFRRSPDEKDISDKVRVFAQGGSDDHGEKWVQGKAAVKVWENEHASVYVTGEVQNPSKSGHIGGGAGLGVSFPFGR